MKFWCYVCRKTFLKHIWIALELSSHSSRVCEVRTLAPGSVFIGHSHSMISYEMTACLCSLRPCILHDSQCSNKVFISQLNKDGAEAAGAHDKLAGCLRPSRASLTTTGPASSTKLCRKSPVTHPLHHVCTQRHHPPLRTFMRRTRSPSISLFI